MRNCLYGFEIYLVNVKTMRTIAQIFVAFSEKLNFNSAVSLCLLFLNVTLLRLDKPETIMASSGFYHSLLGLLTTPLTFSTSEVVAS